LGDGNGPAYQIVDIQEDLVIFSPVKADGAVDDKVKLVLNKEPDSVPQPPAGDRLPLGIPIAGMPGYVSSPYLPNASIIDVRDVSPGTKVRDPYTGKVFLVP